MTAHRYTGDEIKAKRKALRMTQEEFWARLEVTQSGGSRYETGRDIPAPVQILLNLLLEPKEGAWKLLKERRREFDAARQK